jgi:hypothetical protein
MQDAKRKKNYVMKNFFALECTKLCHVFIEEIPIMKFNEKMIKMLQKKIKKYFEKKNIYIYIYFFSLL